MSPDLVLVAALVVFVAFVLLEIPIGIALVVAGAVGILLMDGADLAGAVLGAVPFSSTSSYAMFAIPGFVLMGAVIANAGISRHIFYGVSRVLHWLPNSVAVTAVMATTIMSGISGSSAANVATMGRISVKEMRRAGYDTAQAAAIVAAAGAFGALIPPAIGLVVYGIVAGESVGALLLAGIVPGLLSAFSLVVYLILRGGRAHALPDVDAVELGARVRAAAAEHAAVGARPRGAAAGGGAFVPQGLPGADPSDTRAGRATGLGIAAVLFVVVMGGIYSGVMTATEAAAVGGFGALLLVALGRQARSGSMWRIARTSLEETTRTTAMIFLLLIGGAMVTYLVVASSMPVRLSHAIMELPVPPTVVIALFLLALIPLGMFLDGMSIILLTVPIVAPVVDALGFDGIWFGILFMKLMEIGLITPPVGLNCFVVAGVVPGLKVEAVFRSILPLVLLDLGVTAVLFLFPGLVTWLPDMVGG